MVSVRTDVVCGVHDFNLIFVLFFVLFGTFGFYLHAQGNLTILYITFCTLQPRVKVLLWLGTRIMIHLIITVRLF